MAYTRLKKLTNTTYAPTNPTTEALARSIVDDAIDELNVAYASDDGADYIGESHGNTVQARIDYIEQELVDITQGAVADDSITTAKLADDAVTTDKIIDDAVTTDKIANDTISDANMSAALKKGVAGGLAAYNDQMYYKLVDYVTEANATQIDVSLSGITIANYHEIKVVVKNIIGVTAGNRAVTLRLNNNSGSIYTNTNTAAGSAPSEFTGQASMGSAGYSATYSAQVEITLYQYSRFTAYRITNVWSNDSTDAIVQDVIGYMADATAVSSVNFICGTADEIKAGAEVIVYGVLK